MSSQTPAPETGRTESGVFVEIPRAKRGQEYKAPKNFPHPFGVFITQVIIVVICASLPITPAAIIGLIVFAPTSQVLHDGLGWLWLSMFLFVEVIALFVAINVGREALGISGSGRLAE